MRLGGDEELWLVRERELISRTKLYHLERVTQLVRIGSQDYVRLMSTHTCCVPESHIQKSVYHGFQESNEIRLVSFIILYKHGSFA